MTEDIKAAYETIDALQLRQEYDAIQQLAQYAADALANDGQAANLLVNGVMTGKP